MEIVSINRIIGNRIEERKALICTDEEITELIELAENDIKLKKVSNRSVEELIRMYEAGYTMQLDKE